MIPTSPSSRSTTSSTVPTVSGPPRAGAALEVRADGEFANFDHVRVDGVRVDEMHYDAREGSTIITLKPSFLSTLSDGVPSLCDVSRGQTPWHVGACQGV